jgi:hypothetical protein
MRKGRIQQDFGSGKGLRGMSFCAFDGEDEGAQAAELAAIVFAEAGHEMVGPGLDLGPHGLQQLDAFRGDVGDCLSLVFVAAGAADEFSCLQTIDEARNIRGAVQHAAGDLAARVPARVDAAKNPEHIVLRPGDAMLGAQAVHKLVQRGGGNDHAQERLLYGTGEVGLLQALAERIRHRFFIGHIAERVTRAGQDSWDGRPGWDLDFAHLKSLQKNSQSLRVLSLALQGLWFRLGLIRYLQ